MASTCPGGFAKWLLGRAGASGTPEAGATVALGRTQGELAAELGTTRSTLNRALQGFLDLDLVAVDGETVTLLDPGALTAYTG